MPKVSKQKSQSSWFNKVSTFDLKKRKWLFKAMQMPVLGSVGPAILEKALDWNLPIKSLLKLTLFEQFCGGENLEECKPVIAELAQNNLKTTLDYGVESNFAVEKARGIVQELRSVIDFTSQNENVRFSVLKLSALVEDEILERISRSAKLSAHQEKAWASFKKTTFELFAYAAKLRVRVFVDAEQSWFQPAIDQIAEEGMAQFNLKEPIIYTTIQLYRHDRLAYLNKLMEDGKKSGYILAVKLVRGAYMESERARAEEKEYPSPIQPDKAHTDRDFDQAIALCLDHIDRVAMCCGSHNQKSCDKAASMILDQKINPANDFVDFSQLYGMSDFLSVKLVQQGFNVSKYLPYGPVSSVVPYLVRRARENSSVNEQSIQELKQIERELERREKLL